MNDVLQAALFLLLDRAGGEISFTQAEFLGIAARRGDYRVVATTEHPDGAEPRVVVRIMSVPGTMRPA